jgi:hypothetical protein
VAGTTNRSSRSGGRTRDDGGLVAHDDRQVEERDVPLRDGRDLVVELEPDRNSRLETMGEPEERVPRTHERVDDERSASRGSGCDRSDVSADPPAT